MMFLKYNLDVIQSSISAPSSDDPDRVPERWGPDADRGARYPGYAVQGCGGVLQGGGGKWLPPG